MPRSPGWYWSPIHSSRQAPGKTALPSTNRTHSPLSRAFSYVFRTISLLFLNLLLFFLPEALLLFRPDIYLYLLALRVMLLFGFQFYISSLLMERLFLTLEAGGR